MKIRGPEFKIRIGLSFQGLNLSIRGWHGKALAAKDIQCTLEKSEDFD